MVQSTETMPLQTGFLYSFYASCKPLYQTSLIDNYPARADGYFTMNPVSFPYLLENAAVKNLSPGYYEVVLQSLDILEKYHPYTDEVRKSSHLVFTFKDTPILVFENLSIANSDWIMKIDMSYLIPHWISLDNLESRTISEKRYKVLGLLGLFFAYGFLK
jgi:hypothetical protein